MKRNDLTGTVKLPYMSSVVLISMCITTLGTARTVLPETDHAMHVDSQSCISTSYIQVCLCMTAAYKVYKACAVLINTHNPYRRLTIVSSSVRSLFSITLCMFGAP